MHNPILPGPGLHLGAITTPTTLRLVRGPAPSIALGSDGVLTVTLGPAETPGQATERVNAWCRARGIAVEMWAEPGHNRAERRRSKRPGGRPAKGTK